MPFNLSFLSRAGETRNKLRLSETKWKLQRQEERERIAKTEMSELSVNCREYLADSSTNTWQLHLFICQSPRLQLQFEVTAILKSLPAILSEEKNLKHFTCQNPYYNPQNVKCVNQGYFLWKSESFVPLSFILSGHSCCWCHPSRANGKMVHRNTSDIVL